MVHMKSKEKKGGRASRSPRSLRGARSLFDGVVLTRALVFPPPLKAASSSLCTHDPQDDDSAVIALYPSVPLIPHTRPNT